MAEFAVRSDDNHVAPDAVAIEVVSEAENFKRARRKVFLEHWQAIAANVQ
jgi:hypothetical protein